jgi:hypothetical protein
MIEATVLVATESAVIAAALAALLSAVDTLTPIEVSALTAVDRLVEAVLVIVESADVSVLPNVESTVDSLVIAEASALTDFDKTVESATVSVSPDTAAETALETVLLGRLPWARSHINLSWVGISTTSYYEIRSEICLS